MLFCSILCLDNIVLIVNDNCEIEIKFVEVVCIIVKEVFICFGIEYGSLVVRSVVLNLYNGMKVCFFGDEFVFFDVVELDVSEDIDKVESMFIEGDSE